MRGAALYFVRLQMAHLHEALKIVNEIQGRPNLRRLVDECHATDLFDQLLTFAKGGPQRGDFQRYVELVRHKVTFHYDQDMVQAALDDRAGRRGDTAHFVTLADDISRVRFQVADDLVNTLVCHQIWEITPGPEAQTEADRIADFGFRIYETFLDFAATFIAHYVRLRARFTH
jgi:hypothetical protein